MSELYDLEEEAASEVELLHSVDVVVHFGNQIHMLKLFNALKTVFLGKAYLRNVVGNKINNTVTLTLEGDKPWLA